MLVRLFALPGNSKARVKQGYPSIELVGWAAEPRYDKIAHKFYWAIEFTRANAELSSRLAWQGLSIPLKALFPER